jgi:hypothetical protein
LRFSVFRKTPDVSKEHIAFIFTVKEWATEQASKKQMASEPVTPCSLVKKGRFG